MRYYVATHASQHEEHLGGGSISDKYNIEMMRLLTRSQEETVVVSKSANR